MKDLKITIHSVEFQNFTVTQILREINLVDFRRLNTAIMTILKALIFEKFQKYQRLELMKCSKLQLW